MMMILILILQLQTGFDFFLSQFSEVGLPYKFGSPTTMTYYENKSPMIENAMKEQFLKLSGNSSTQNYKYFARLPLNDSIAVVIYEVSHGTGQDYNLAVYDIRKQKLIDCMTLFYESDGGFWAAGVIDTHLIITQECYSFKQWAGSTNKNEVVKLTTNKLQITLNGINALEGKKIEPIH